MKEKLIQMRWRLHQYKSKKMLIWGLKHGFIAPYSDEVIAKLRTVYYGGIPASIILLSNGLSNGHCYDRALLMAEAFLNNDVDVKLIYAAVDSLKLNPQYQNNPDDADHCFVEITSKKGRQFIIDTSSGLIYDKNLYWLKENPKVRKINNKEDIIKIVKLDKESHPESIEKDKYASAVILPLIEATYNKPGEIYSLLGIELLQREIAYYKKAINYEELCQEINEDMKRLGIKK